jgi:hypothetical protein
MKRPEPGEHQLLGWIGEPSSWQRKRVQGPEWGAVRWVDGPTGLVIGSSTGVAKGVRRG